MPHRKKKHTHTQNCLPPKNWGMRRLVSSLSSLSAPRLSNLSKWAIFKTNVGLTMLGGDCRGSISCAFQYFEIIIHHLLWESVLTNQWKPLNCCFCFPSFGVSSRVRWAENLVPSQIATRRLNVVPQNCFCFIYLGSWIQYGGFLKWGYPQIIYFNGLFSHKPTIWGYSHLWKHPYNSMARCSIDKSEWHKFNIFQRQRLSWRKRSVPQQWVISGMHHIWTQQPLELHVFKGRN